MAAAVPNARTSEGAEDRTRSLRLVRSAQLSRGAITPWTATWVALPVGLAPGEPMPPPGGMNRNTPGAVTVEGVTEANGTEVWSYSGARELL